jgi:hypothetical protein
MRRRRVSRLHRHERSGSDLGRRQPIGAHRAGNVLNALLPEILEAIGELVADLIADDPRDAQAARLRERLQARCNIDPIAENIVAIGDDVAEIDADAELNAPLVRHICLAREHPALKLDSAAHRIHDTGELDQHAVAGGLDYAAAVLADLRVDQLAPVRLKAGERALLIRAHKSRIPGHIGSQDRGKPPDDGNVLGNRHPRHFSAFGAESLRLNLSFRYRQTTLKFAISVS